jgi:CheY-like chemotaxis protein
MDIKMPEIDGLEAARCIQKISPGIPIIALTAFAMEGDRSMCLESGCIDYIAKPIEKVKLLKIMDRYIHQQHEKSLTSNMRNH